jgi:hypothetical protein
MVWLPESMDDSWKTMTLTDPEWRLRMAKWGSEDLLGPVWIACLAGLPLFLFAGLRGGLLLLWSIGCMLGFVRLGWHTKQHDYDFLLVLPAFAAGFGASFALLARLAARLLGNRLQRTPDWLKKGAPYIALALVLAALSPGAHKQSRRHFYTGMDEVGLQEKLDKVLPRGEAIHYLGGKNDPRVPYYANRRAWGTEAGLYCLRREVKYDCLLGAGPEGGRLSPCIERAPAVAWSTGALTCDILHPERPLVPARVLTTVATHIRFPKDQNFPGVGHLYGSDPVACGTWKVPCAGNLERIEFFDFYFVPEVNAPPVQLLADGTPLSVKPEPSRWTAGTLIVARAELPKGAAPAKLELKVQESVVPLTEK